MRVSSLLSQLLKMSACVMVGALLLPQPLLTFAQRPKSQAQHATVTVSYTPAQPANRFIPAHALGAGVDGHGEGETVQQLTTENIQSMLSAGLTPLTYRLRTELAGEAWHWNPDGSWSDAASRRGYWTSESEPREPIQ